MARLLDAASSQYLVNIVSAPVTNYPLTMAIWFNCNDDSGASGLSELLIGDVNADYWQLRILESTHTVQFRVSASGVFTASTTTTWSTNNWNHACCVGASSTD